MFKKSLLLMLLMALMAPWVANAQTLTVYDDESATSRYVPIDGYNVDGTSIKTEYIMPSTALTAMNGKEITQMTLYLQTVGNRSWGNAVFRVFMKEVETTTISSLSGYSNATVVYVGGLDCQNTEMNVVFDNSYSYGGGNLLIGFYVDTKGTYTGTYDDYKPIYYGETVNGASIYYYTSTIQQNFLPKTKFTYQDPPTCPKPNNLHANLTEGNGSIATLVWTENGSAANWEVIYGTDPTLETHFPPITTGFNVDGSTISCDLSGLTAETPHYAKVKAVCEAGVDESEYTDIIEFTPSNYHTITVNDPTTTTSAYIPVYYYLGSSSTTKSQFIIPSTNLTNMQWGEIKKLTFYNQTATVNFGTAKFNIYLATTSNTTLSSFVEWSTMTKVVTNGSISVSGNKMEIVFDTPYTYTGGNIIIGFSQTSSGTSASYSDKWVGVTGASGASRYYVSSESSQSFLPKVTFTYLEGEEPDCLPVSNLSYSNEQTSSVDLNWNAGESAETAWKLQYKKTTEDDWTTYPSAITEKPFTLPNLSETTTYQWQVAAWCDTSDPDGISDYVAGENFTTKQSPVVVGDSWSDNFEGESCGWLFANGTQTNKWAWGTATNNGGTKSIYVSNDSGTSNAYSNTLSVVYATKLLTFAENKYEFSYDWIANGESNYDYLRVWLAPASFVFTPGQLPNGGNTSTDFKNYVSSTETGWIPLDGTVETGGKLNLSTTWQNKSIAQNVAAGNYYLVLMWCNDGSTGSTPPAAVDNFSITRVACGYDVAGLEVATEPAPTAHTATINWTAGDPGQWQVAWSKDNTFAPANTQTKTVSTNTINLVDLDAASTYYVKVRAYCGGEDYGTWCEAIDFPTECEAISDFPWSYNFNSDATGNFSKQCWLNDIVSGSYKFRITSSTNGSNSTNQLYMDYHSGSVAKLVLPELAIPTGKTYQFVIDVYRTTYSTSYDDGIRVYANTSRDLEGATELGFLYRVCTKTDGGVVTDETTTGWYTYAFDLPYDGSCFVILKGEGQGGNSTYVDNFVIRQAPDCDTPTGLAVTANSQTPEGATITWDNVDETSWIVEYKKTADEDWTAIATPVATNTYTFTGLDAETTYQARIKVNCTTGDGVTYPTNPVQFTTDVACPTPKQLVVNGVTASTATFSWTPGYDETSWTVKYKKHADEEYTTAVPNPVTTTSITIGELTGATAYDVQIIGCDPTHIYSVSNAFTTAYSTPFAEPFDASSIPANWNKYSTLLTDDVLNGNTALSSGGDWTFNSRQHVFGEYHGVLNIYGQNCKSWLVTPNITIGSGMSLSFDLALTDYNNANAIDDPEGQAEDKFIVLISTDAGHTWTILRQWDNAGSEYVYNDIATAGESVYVDLASYSGQTARIAFYGESTISKDSGVDDNDLHIDNVEIGATPSCYRPSGLTASGVTNHSATLTWNPGSNDQTAWEFKYNIGEDFDPTEAGTLIENITANPHTFDKTLDAASTYYFYVRGNCGGEPSAWSKKVCSFTTEAVAPAPTTFAKTEVGSDWVDLYWNAPAGDYLSGYGIYYSTSSTEPTEETDATVTIDNPIAPTSEEPYHMPGLENETTYYLWIRANHETDVYSAWKAITGASITTLPSCPIPTDLNASNLTQNTADLSWTGLNDVLTSDGYTVEYRVLTISEETETITETFAGYTAVTYSSTGELPTGWKGYTSGTYKPHVSNNSALGTSYDITGIGGGEGGTDNFLYMIGNTYSPNNSFTILPQFGSIVAVSFDYAFESTSYGALSVGYCTENSSGSTFTPFDDLTIDATTTSTNVNLTAADIAAINSKNGYLAFRWNCSSAYGIAIDNIAITTHIYNAGAWQTAVTEYKTGYTYQLTSLTAGTKYDVRVYSGCTTDADNENASTSFFTLAENNIVFPSDGTWTAGDFVPSGAPTTEDDVIIRGDVTITNGTNAYANDINIENGAIIIVENGATLTIAGGFDGDAESLFIKEGGQVIHTNAIEATAQKNITAYTSKDGDGWYMIASPVNGLSTTALATGTYDLFAYDEATAYWWVDHAIPGQPANHTFTTLERGKGYLYANDTDVTLNFSGEMIGTATEISKTLSYACSYDDVKGYNLMGNPFTRNIGSGDMTLDGEPVTSVLILNNDEEYQTCNFLESGTVTPGQGFFIQATAANQELTFNPSSKDESEIGLISIKAGNESYFDKAYIQIGGGNTLRKMTFYGDKSMVYVMNDDDYAATTVYELAGAIPVNFKAAEDGEYSITVNTKNLEASTMLLYDDFTGVTVNLLESPTYHFKASESDNADRFKLIFDFNNYTGVNENYTNDNFAHQIGDEIFVSGEGTLQVFDVLGRFVTGYNVNGDKRISTAAFNTGVYIFRMVGTEVKTQKIVIR